MSDAVENDEQKDEQVVKAPLLDDPLDVTAGIQGNAVEAPEIYIPLRFVDIVMVLPSTHPLLVLEEIDPPHRQLRIPVGGAEGVALAYGARQIATPRPLSHELFATMLEAFSIGIDAVRITKVNGSAYQCQICCSGPRGARTFECRTSDAVALVLRQSLPAPISAAPEVLDQAGFAPDQEG
jgi:bifunctional DNase/RNase